MTNPIWMKIYLSCRPSRNEKNGLASNAKQSSTFVKDKKNAKVFVRLRTIKRNISIVLYIKSQRKLQLD